MAEENQTLKLPNEDKRENEEEIVQQKPLSISQNDASPDRSAFEPPNVDQSSQSETLVATFHPQQSDVKPTVTLEFKTEQFVMSHQAVTCVTAQGEGQMQIQDDYSSSSMELLPVPIEQSLSSSITPCPLRPRSPTFEQDNDVSMAIVKHENSSDNKMELAHVLAKSPSPDGYNWRKYGQKPVKSNDSSRSYYRCTYVNCIAKKKIERCDHSGSVVEIIYKGGHNHDPPRKVRRTKARCLSLPGPISSPEPGEGNEVMDCPTREPVGSYTSTSGTKHNQDTPEQKLHSPKDCSSIAIFKSEEDYDRIPAKRRMKGGSVTFPDPLCKTIKEPKVVVQAAGDVGMAADGYRWRKYGQKMVKGNSNPRSYYKCTSAGCPVRKHVEKAADDATIMITYEGKHDHDMPTPKKHQGPLSDALPIMAATAIDDAELKESEALVNPENSTQCSMDVEREVVNEKASEFGGGKALESARTLLSIGIELRPY